jgi:hypothetical protein
MRSRQPGRVRPGLERLESRSLLSGNTPELELLPPDGAPPVAIEPSDWTMEPPRLAATKVGEPLILVNPAIQRMPLLLPPGLDRTDSTWIIERTDLQGRSPDAVFPFWHNYIEEVSHPHPSMGAAQRIDASMPVMIGGTVAEGDVADFFHIPGNSAAIRVVITSADAFSNRADRLYIFDEWGRMVGDWTMPSSAGGLAVDLLASDNREGHGLFVGVGPAEEAPRSGSEESYIIQIVPLGQATSPEPTPTNPGGARPAQPGATHEPGPVRAAAAQPMTGGNHSTTSRTATSVPARDDSPAPLVPQGTVAGPLPTRETAPFGGVLASGDPHPALGSDQGAQVELTLVDLGVIELTSKDGADEVTEPSWPIDPDGLVDVIEDGQLPLVTATRSRAPLEDALFDEVLVEGEGDGVPVELMTPVVRLDPSCEEPGSRRRAFPVALGLVTALAMTLTLPDLAPLRNEARSRRRLPLWLRSWLERHPSPR